MSLSINRIMDIFNSRRIILELLDLEKYQITDYGGFSINEIEIMYKNNQLDMLVSNEETNKKIYIKYFLDKTIGKHNTDEIIEDLFITENPETSQPTLLKNDTLVIITDDDPNDTTIKNIRYQYDNNGIYIMIFNIRRLRFNVRKHELNPQIRIMKDEEVKKLQHQYNIENLSVLLPEISRFDPLAMSIFMRPGQVCHIIRNSPTAINSDYYRICK